MMGNDLIEIVIADDHPIVRQGLRQMIEGDRGLTIVGEAGDGATALEIIERHAPQIVVLDIDMPTLGGFDVVRELRRKKSDVKIVFLSMHSEEEIFSTAIDLGVSGYILKDSVTTEIVSAIRSVASGKSFISPSLSHLLLSRRNRAEKLKNDKPGLDLLTPTERRILKLIAEDKTSKEIGAELFISHRTVHAHRANISSKLNLSGNLALVKFAITHKSEL